MKNNIIHANNILNISRLIELIFVNINLFKNDDPAGEAFVYYDHDNLTEYNTGSVKFDVEIR